MELCEETLVIKPVSIVLDELVKEPLDVVAKLLVPLRVGKKTKQQLLRLPMEPHRIADGTELAELLVVGTLVNKVHEWTPESPAANFARPGFLTARVYPSEYLLTDLKSGRVLQDDDAKGLRGELSTLRFR